MKWRATQLKYVAILVAGGTPRIDEPRYWSDNPEHGVPWVTIGDMTRSPRVHKTVRRVSFEGLSSLRLQVGKPGTILFAMYASVGALAVLDCHAAWNQAIVGVRARAGISESRFVRYWLESLRPSLAELFRSNTQDNLNAEQVASLPFPGAPVEEQREIADFLDAETARIDALIAKKVQLVHLLQSRRLAATAAAVSGRLTRPHDDRTQSSLPWLDSQPAEWQTVKLTLVARLGSGHTPSRDHAEWWEDCTVPWITTGEVAQLREDRIEYITETREKISEQGIANSSATIHPAGTVVLSRTASAGFSAIMGTDMATSQDFATWTCGPLLEPRFLLLCLRAMRQDLLSRLAQGSTHKTIYMPDMESIRIPLPPLEEQREVVQMTWRRLKPVDVTADCLHRQIALLHERRQALINAAVTGELDVPGLAA